MCNWNVYDFFYIYSKYSVGVIMIGRFYQRLTGLFVFFEKLGEFVVRMSYFMLFKVKTTGFCAFATEF